MQWQDIVFSVGAWVFVIALIPTLRSKDKPPAITSLISGIVLAIFAITYFTLSLFWSSFAQSIVAILWLVLAYQKYTMQKKEY